jgi:hypothetical protein
MSTESGALAAMRRENVDLSSQLEGVRADLIAALERERVKDAALRMFPAAVAPLDDPGGYVYIEEWEAFQEAVAAAVTEGP